MDIICATFSLLNTYSYTSKCTKIIFKTPSQHCEKRYSCVSKYIYIYIYIKLGLIGFTWKRFFRWLLLQALLKKSVLILQKNSVYMPSFPFKLRQEKIFFQFKKLCYNVVSQIYSTSRTLLGRRYS